MARIIAILSFAAFVALMGCSSEEIQCNGVLVGNTCYPAETGCQSDQECLPTGVCLNGTCGQECTSDAGCLNGYTCQTYRCVLVTRPGADTVDLPADTVDPPADTVDPPADVGDCPPKDGAYGDLCECKEQCATLLCVQNFLTGQNSCTQYCTADINCPGTDICVLVDEDPKPAGTSICYYNDAGVTPPSCDPNLAGCFKGMVLNNQLGQCVCTVPCIDAAGSCPAGMACHFDQSVMQKYCVAVGEFCAVAQNPCYSGSCLDDGQTGYCTAICQTAADCPAGWSCQGVEGGSACVKL